MGIWKNWETQNVATWIASDENILAIARLVYEIGANYLYFASIMMDEFDADATPHGVAWDHPSLDIATLDEFIADAATHSALFHGDA